MASSSVTPARRSILSELNVNSPITLPSGSDSSKMATSVEKPALMAASSLQTSSTFNRLVQTIPREAGLLGTKRCNPDLAEAPLSQRSPKMLKTENGQTPCLSSVAEVHRALRWPAGGSTDLAFGYEKTSFTPHTTHVAASPPPSPVAGSPISSGGFSETGLNDTQLTEPDEPRAAAPLTLAELQEKARAIRLRLRLANYKVRTNQINLPMSHLQLKTSCPDRLPAHRSQITLPPHRTPLPSSIPDIQLQKPSAEKRRRPSLTELSSSPPPLLDIKSRKHFIIECPTKEPEDEDEPRDEFATPLLPRHRQGLLNPPNLGSPSREELTSSVVKRGTADVLLSLKLQR